MKLNPCLPRTTPEITTSHHPGQQGTITGAAAQHGNWTQTRENWVEFSSGQAHPTAVLQNLLLAANGYCRLLSWLSICHLCWKTLLLIWPAVFTACQTLMGQQRHFFWSWLPTRKFLVWATRNTCDTIESKSCKSKSINLRTATARHLLKRNQETAKTPQVICSEWLTNVWR